MSNRVFASIVVLLIGGFCLMACSGSDDDVINETSQPQPGQETVVTLTGTLNAKNGGTTRSVVSDGTAAWAASEEIALYYRGLLLLE